jgi:hypothetical protein
MKAPDFATGQDEATNYVADVMGQRYSDFLYIIGLALDATILAASRGPKAKLAFTIRMTLVPDGISKATEITRELCADRPLRVKPSSCCGHIIMVVLASPTKWEESSVKG